jgi:hypothetical protein
VVLAGLRAVSRFRPFDSCPIRRNGANSGDDYRNDSVDVATVHRQRNGFQFRAASGEGFWENTPEAESVSNRILNLLSSKRHWTGVGEGTRPCLD